VLVYDAPNSFQGALDEFSSIVSDDRAQEISTSWGVCESVIATDDPSLISSENTLLEEAATQGQALFSSSGDSGAEDCSQQGGGNFSLSAEDPSAQPFATGVGGTTLTGGGPPPTETVWNDGPNSECNCGAIQGIGGTGGGISDEWTMPSYQSAAAQALGVTNAHSSATPCGGGAVDCREVPDVSADGDPMTGYVIFDGGNWDVIGGTSASAPLWAAYTALVNASAACRGQRVGFANPILYQIAGSNYAANFHDITAASPYTGLDNNDTFDGAGGGTDVDNPNHLFPMKTGYDMATGLGSPIGNTLAASLCAIRSPVYSVSVTNPGAQSTVVGNSVALAVQGIDSGGLALSYAASGLPAGLSINPATGTISGTPAAAGSSTVTVTAADTFTNTGATQFSWTVTSPPPPPPVAGSPVVSGASLGGIATRKAKLKFTVDAGSNAPALHAVRIALPSGVGFVSKHKTLLKGISVKGSKFTAQLAAGKLTLTFSGPVQQATITVGPPATNVTKGLATKARHPKHKTVKVTVTAIDAAGLATAIPELLRL
jgi:subtilase family serine protease